MRRSPSLLATFLEDSFITDLWPPLFGDGDCSVPRTLVPVGSDMADVLGCASTSPMALLKEQETRASIFIASTVTPFMGCCMVARAVHARADSIIHQPLETTKFLASESDTAYGSANKRDRRPKHPTRRWFRTATSSHTSRKATRLISPLEYEPLPLKTQRFTPPDRPACCSNSPQGR